MKQLSINQCLQVEGAGILGWIVPCVAGFIFGGPAGVMVVASTYIATKGVDNLEHLYTHNEVPSMGHVIYGH